MSVNVDIIRDIKKGQLTRPSMDELNFWAFDGVCEAACPHQCLVEPDGHCEHGRPSWLLAYGLI